MNDDNGNSEDDMHADQRFDEFLQREAQHYNTPGDTPREEMWAAISASRLASPHAARLTTRLPHPASRRRTPYVLVAMAATLAIGVAIGRYTFREHSAPPVLAMSTATPTDSVGPAYNVAATEHLARAEALLTAFGSSVADPASDAQFAGWARDVLANTRLMLDSPAARDPSRRRLLEDLELVLVQIVQRSPAEGAAAERAHVNRSLERTQVLTRLRSALPSGLNSGT